MEKQIKELPTIEYLRSILDYDPETGVISWKIDRVNCEKGKAVYARNDNGYLKMRIKGKDLRVHRVVFLLMTGSWPKFAVDHINGNKIDNRFCNLREATIAQNSQNSKFRKTNTSGFKGVSWNKAARKWHAYICENRKLHFLGLFDKIEDAIDARTQAVEKLHGEFASHKCIEHNKEIDNTLISNNSVKESKMF